MSRPEPAGRPGNRADRESLIRIPVDDVPPAPAFVALARFLYEPGAFFPPAAGAGPVAIHVEAGSLTFNAQAPVLWIRAGGGEERPAPGTDFTVGPGDQLLVPGGVLHTARSNGPGAASTVGVALFAGAPALQFPPGISFQPMVTGLASTLPTGSGTIALERVTLDAGEHVHGPPSAGVEMLFVERGSMSFRARRGDVRVTRAAAGPFGMTEPAPPRQDVLLGAGDGTFAQEETLDALREAGGAGAAALHVALEP